MTAAIAKATATGTILAFVLGTILFMLVPAESESAAFALSVIMLTFAAYSGARLALYWTK